MRGGELIALLVRIVLLTFLAQPAAAQQPAITIGVHPFGAAFGGLAANRGRETAADSEFGRRDLKVQFKILHGTAEQAFDDLTAERIDLVVLSTDVAALQCAKHKGADVEVVFHTGWSEGSLGIVARPQFTDEKSLANARIAVPRHTPSHYYLRRILGFYGMGRSDVRLVYTDTTEQAADAFRRGEADAAVLWEPYLSRVLAEGHARIVTSTKNGSRLIGSVLLARRRWLDQNGERITRFLGGWDGGVQRTKSHPLEAIAEISAAVEVPEAEVQLILDKTRLTRPSEAADYFGIGSAKMVNLYEQDLKHARAFWGDEGVIRGQEAGPWKPKARVEFLSKLAPPSPAPAPVVRQVRNAHPAVKKSVLFKQGSAELDEEARKEIRSFAFDEAQAFLTAPIRVEGQTDNRGTPAFNLELSIRRAQAVARELMKFVDPGRLIVVGRGIARVESADKAKDRRTELFLEYAE